MNHPMRQTLIVGKIEKGIANPSRAVAEYIQARRENIVHPNPALVRATWDALTEAEQARIDALLMEAMRG